MLINLLILSFHFVHYSFNRCGAAGSRIIETKTAQPVRTISLLYLSAWQHCSASGCTGLSDWSNKPSLGLSLMSSLTWCCCCWWWWWWYLTLTSHISDTPAAQTHIPCVLRQQQRQKELVGVESVAYLSGSVPSGHLWPWICSPPVT